MRITCCFFIFLSSALLFITVAQTVPTTLQEMFGENGYSIISENISSKITEGSWIRGADMPFPDITAVLLAIPEMIQCGYMFLAVIPQAVELLQIPA